MTLTNVYDLPEQIVKLVENEKYTYTPGRYSVTEILNSTKEIILKRRYKERLIVDVSDHVNMLFGTAFHKLFETDDENSEVKIEFPVSNSILSGRIDLIKDFILEDYKTCSAWKWKSQDFSDWDKQGLIYVWILNKLGRHIEKLRFTAFIKDFSKGRKEYEKDYPVAQIMVHERKITSRDLKEIEEFIFKKIAEIEYYIDKPNNELPEPLDEELWKTPDKYAVMKNNGKRALKVYDNEKDANVHLLTNGGDYIEKREGTYKKLEYDESLRQLFKIGDKEVWPGTNSS